MSAVGARPSRILVASNIEALRCLLAPLLQKQGCEMIEAASGAAALQEVYQDQPDVALVDLVLPDMNGLQFLRQVQKVTYKVPVILFAATEDTRLAVEVMKQGAVDCLTKPFRREEILQALHVAQAGKQTPPELPSPQAQEAGVRQANKLETLGRLTSAVAHDLNNQMTVILGYTQLLLNQFETGGHLGESLREIQRAADQAAALTRQLLDFSRKQEPAPRHLELNALIAGLDKMVRRLVGENIAVALDLEAREDRIRADPRQIEQVIMNLVLNARDAMPGGGKLTIATANDPAGMMPGSEQGPSRIQPTVKLVVSDNGCGMDAKTLSHIFEPFFTTKPQGTGQGLCISQKIIAENGGGITVESLPQLGTTFTIYFPQAAETAEAEALATPAALDVPTGSETILLVEDNRDVQAMLREFLRRQGYTVLEAQSGREALHMCKHHQGLLPLLITDVALPQMSGLELANHLAEIRPMIKVLFMSGYTAGKLFEQGIKEPGRTFIQKPFSTEVLAKVVRELLDS